MKRAAQNNIVSHRMFDGQIDALDAMSLGVMDVLTPVLGFENGTYALHCAGYEYIGDIAISKRSDIASVTGITENKMKRLRSYLRKFNLTFETQPTAEWSEWRSAVMDKEEPTHPIPRRTRPVLRLVR
jgi:hypothetical protein